jgi:enterochelin esterase-like enzyme
VRTRRIAAIAAVLVLAAAWGYGLFSVYRHYFPGRPAVPRHTQTTTVRPSGSAPVELAIEPFTLHSAFLRRSLREVVVVPEGEGKGRPLLVLLHGRGGSPGSFLTKPWLEALAGLGARAPDVLLVDGGDQSYYHNRSGGRWASYLYREAIPVGARKSKADGSRIAIGGISMGGFGSMLAGLRNPGRFCAVGGHSAALWRTEAETPAGAFDDVADFDRNNVLAMASSRKSPLGRSTRVWIDVGDRDPFDSADTELAHTLRMEGQRVVFHVWPGGHEGKYWNAHAAQYLRFYAQALDRC